MTGATRRQRWITVRLGRSASLGLTLWLLATTGGAGQLGSIAPSHGRLTARGWVLREVRWDPVLLRAWAIYADPRHPERPTIAVLAQDADQGIARGAAEVQVLAAAAAVPVVHLGDHVRLWSVEKNIRLQLSAVAEENGAIGERIRLSIPGAVWEDGVPGLQAVRGLVRGAGDVEMEP